MNIFQSITEGGQLTTHSVRMFKQVTKTSLCLALFLWLGVFIYQIRAIKQIHFQSIWYYEQARLLKVLQIKTMEIDQHYWFKVAGENQLNKVSVDRVTQIAGPYAINVYHFLLGKLNKSALYSALPFFIIILFFFFRGRHSSQKHHIKGNKLSSRCMVTWKLKLSRMASKISIGSLPLVKGTETQHILITGGTGSGKTNCLHHLLMTIREQKQKTIIIDTTEVLTHQYYREGKDIILNPLDSRAAPWHPWVECFDKSSYSAMAESFIPQSLSESDNYWRTSARIVLSSLFEQLEKITKNSALTEKILHDPLEKLCAFVKGTKAASLIDINSEKTAASIRAVLSSFLSCFEYLSDTDKPFSIRNWLSQKNQDEWLFLSCKTNQRAALNPLLSCWFSVAVRGLLELTPDFNRRVWFIIDELPTLNRLRDLETLLSESRKYGGCTVLALQSPAQLDAIYGQSSAQVIVGNCATKIVFAEQNPINAARIAEIFGEQEIKEYQKGLSYGANDVRDGVNLNQQIRYQQLISKTDIQFLPRNYAFIRLPDNYPIIKTKIPLINNRRTYDNVALC